MSERSEDRPHVVYAQGDTDDARVLPNYAEAFAAWKTLHHFKYPYLIAVLGRHCTPAAEIVDVAE